MKKSVLFALLTIVTLFVVNQQVSSKKVVFPAGYESKIDEVYTTVNGWSGRVDIYYNPQSQTPTPIVIQIHGGGWNHGTKESQTGFGTYFKAGLAVANVEYRLVDKAIAPGAIEDIRCALKFIKLHANELNIDPRKVILAGTSAGAHLALMGGLLENDNRFDLNCDGKVDMKVAAIISMYAPSNFNDTSVDIKQFKSLIHWFGKNVNNPTFINSISPVSYIKKSSPPVFIVHGNADPVVPYSQSKNLHQKLSDSGVYNEFITVDGGSHGNFDADKKAEINIALINFLNKVLVDRKE